MSLVFCLSFRMVIYYFLSMRTWLNKVRKPRITKLGQGVRSCTKKNKQTSTEYHIQILS